MKRTMLSLAALQALPGQAHADIEIAFDDEPVALNFVEPFNAPTDPMLSARAERRMHKTKHRKKKAFRP